MKGILHLLQPRDETLHFLIDDGTDLEMKNNMDVSYVDADMPSLLIRAKRSQDYPTCSADRAGSTGRADGPSKSTG